MEGLDGPLSLRERARVRGKWYGLRHITILTIDEACALSGYW
jgi:hypothetical protein